VLAVALAVIVAVSLLDVSFSNALSGGVGLCPNGYAVCTIRSINKV
jgi:hypothetical protein